MSPKFIRDQSFLT